MWSNSFSSSVNREGIRAGGGYTGGYISSRRPFLKICPSFRSPDAFRSIGCTGCKLIFFADAYQHYHHAPRSQIQIGLPKIAHPSPRETPDDSTQPREFQITLYDIFGEEVPEGMNPEDPITFSLPMLEKMVTSSLEHTAWYRANKLAMRLTKKAGFWKKSETFTQSKRRRLG